MNRLCARAPGGIENAIDLQVALGRWRRAHQDRLIGFAHVQCRAVRFRINRDRLQAKIAARADYADRDLTAVGNQHSFKHLNSGALDLRSVRIPV